MNAPAAPAAVQLEALGADWPRTACALLAQHGTIARVTVVKLEGSGPRAAGSSMLLTADRQFGSIGGGQLEWRAVQAARALLGGGGARASVALHRFTLGPDLQQCCGGRVELWLERLDLTDLPSLQAAADLLAGGGAVAMVTQLQGGQVSRRLTVVDAAALPEARCQLHKDGSLTLTESWQQSRAALWMFGAGHVGQAILKLLAGLPAFDVCLVDSRVALLAALDGAARLRAAAAPVDCISEAPSGSYFLVMTHDHDLDFALCRALLQRNDFAWLGLIGSASKRARFRSRLAREGVSAERIERLQCPIGVGGIRSKLPQAIAVSVVAQLLQLQEAAAAAQPVRHALHEAEADCGEGCAGCSDMIPRQASA
ncbi:MAG: xanthine dehydrogenase accessory protein XdhC [Steroidobacteraceae bacterium]